MSTSGLFTLIIVGLIIGALGRLVVPGGQRMGILLTIAVGIVSAVAGGFLGYNAIGTHSILLVTVIQVAIAAVLVVGLRGGIRKQS